MKTLFLARVGLLAGEVFVNEYYGEPMDGLGITANEFAARFLAADAHGAEAQDYVASGRGAAEAQHWAETREQEHLVELMA